MTDLQRLTLVYVKERLDRGELNKRSAEVTRCKLRDFALEADTQPSKVNRRHVERWMARPGISPAYRRARLSALRGFCQWCVINGHMRKDPTLGLKAPPLPAYLPRSLPVPQVSQIVAHAPDARARVVLLLMAQEGLRRAEVAAVQLGDVDLCNLTLQVRGKGGRGRITAAVPLSPETAQAIETYLLEVGNFAGPLIRSKVHPDRGITPHSLGELVSRWMADAGVKQAPGDGRSGHALRHSCANHMMDLGATTEQVKAALRHASIRSTEVYVRGRVEPLRDAMAGRSYAPSTETPGHHRLTGESH